jgi:rare lipoprotein A
LPRRLPPSLPHSRWQSPNPSQAGAKTGTGRQPRQLSRSGRRLFHARQCRKGRARSGRPVTPAGKFFRVGIAAGSQDDAKAALGKAKRAGYADARIQRAPDGPVRCSIQGIRGFACAVCFPLPLPLRRSPCLPMA